MHTCFDSSALPLTIYPGQWTFWKVSLTLLLPTMPSGSHCHFDYVSIVPYDQSHAHTPRHEYIHDMYHFLIFIALHYTSLWFDDCVSDGPIPFQYNKRDVFLILVTQIDRSRLNIISFIRVWIFVTACARQTYTQSYLCTHDHTEIRWHFGFPSEDGLASWGSPRIDMPNYTCSVRLMNLMLKWIAYQCSSKSAGVNHQRSRWFHKPVDSVHSPFTLKLSHRFPLLIHPENGPASPIRARLAAW